ncbi:uncharacterized protein PpBr36_11078 [Pyricularia pennisetigena]|uniref:uncharacterized protein n=1 Tax=Pyricularia pennisetigena TaxID=1578925 RepID=UPI00115267AD|nr:uncharacterized protein PpBr36_11078 [Pyricularia pennisetigena]TLS20604.1 hypothetical protein PpBr36_11078 [Pyricularia pennisetigena]
MANSIPDGSWPELVEMARKHQTSMPKGQAELLALKAQIKCHEAQPTSTVSEIKLIYARVLKNEAELLALKVRINAYRARVVHVASVIPRGVSHDTRHPHQCIEQQSSCPKLVSKDKAAK